MLKKIKGFLKRCFLKSKLGKIYISKLVKNVYKETTELHNATLLSSDIEGKLEELSRYFGERDTAGKKITKEEKLKIKLELIARRTKSQRIRKKNLKRLVNLLGEY